MQQINKKKKANTLAEVMIALIIIGVVGAITVPVLKKHAQREETITKLKKGLMSMEQFIDAAILDQGDIMSGMDTKWDMDKLFTKYMVPEMQLARDCSDPDAGESSKCFPSTVYTMDGSTSNITVNSSVVLMDGVAIGNSGMDFYIDINSTNEPNVDGVDVFHYTFENVGRNEAINESGDWKFVPQGYSKQIADNSWKITYW